MAAWLLWWKHVEFGDVAAWLGAIGSFAAVVVALAVAARSSRDDIRDRRRRAQEQTAAEDARAEADRRRQATLVYIEIERTDQARFDSGREDSVTSLGTERLTSIGVEVTVRNRSELPVFTVMPRLTPAPIDPMLPWDRVHGPGERTIMLWFDPDTIVGKGLSPRGVVEFMDVNERWWHRADNGRLTELPGSPWPEWR